MSDIIHLLPDAIANQIAAGEVIQRPASAVKELMENSIDAGATHLQLIVKDAGKTWIQIVDNGCGMSETDARMSFERHATSKIKSADDLFAIRTMGFRGEALASVAAVAQVELKTKRVGDDVGTCITIHGSEVISQEPVHMQAGTGITIKNLFYNVPARRHFLKSNTVEMRHVVDEFQRIALAHPHLTFQLHHNGLEIFHLKSGSLRQRIVALLGNQYNERLVPVEENTSVLKIFGFIGKPEAARKLRGDQFLFVNNRFIKSPYLHHGITNAYENLIPADTHPLYVLFMDIDPARIDVNVHPTKQEIKFEDERIVYTFVSTAAKHALGKYSVTPTLDFDRETSFDQYGMASQLAQVETAEQANANRAAYTPNWTPDFVSPQDHTRVDIPKSHLDVYAAPGLERLTEQRLGGSDWQNQNAATYTIPSRGVEALPTPALNNESDQTDKNTAPVFQLHNRFIVSQIKSGFILVDQQAAHERILYDRYIKNLNGQPGHTQHQLFPQTLNVTPADVEVVNELLPELKMLGFDLQPFGGTAFVLHGAPSDVPQGEEIDMVEKMIDAYKQSQQALKLPTSEALARSMARVNAIRPTKALSEKESRSLLDQLFASESPFYTPDGRHTFITYNLRELEKQFGRKG